MNGEFSRQDIDRDSTGLKGYAVSDLSLDPFWGIFFCTVLRRSLLVSDELFEAVEYTSQAQATSRGNVRKRTELREMDRAKKASMEAFTTEQNKYSTMVGGATIFHWISKRSLKKT